MTVLVFVLVSVVVVGVVVVVAAADKRGFEKPLGNKGLALEPELESEFELEKESGLETDNFEQEDIHLLVLL